MSTVSVSTELEADAAVVFDAVTTVDAFAHVTRGLLTYLPARGRRGRMHEGDELRGWLLLGGVVPFSRHRMRIERIDHAERILRSDEGGGAIRSWRHLIRVTPLAPGRCRYEDVIEIDAGPLTPLVRLFAEGFYRVRQRRWRALAPVLAATAASERADAAAWLGRHEHAFNTGDWEPVMADYADDAVLEAHVDGSVIEVVGRDRIREAVELASAAGTQTSVRRVVADDRMVAAQIDADGRPFMVSFWEVRDGRIARDVSIVLRAEEVAPVGG